MPTPPLPPAGPELQPAAPDHPPDKLSVLVLSGLFERVHYALVMASAAAAIGMPATLFFTDQALRALLQGGPDEAPGWRRLPSADGRPGGAVDDERRERGIAGFEELLGACGELGVRIIVCEMGLRAVGLEASALRADLPIEVAGVVTFLADASATGALLSL
ncbi:MAG: DsrE family protein [Rhodospirillales bacterium]